MNKRGMIDIRIGSVEYQWIEGRCDRPTIVLLHEGLGCIDMWKSFPATLASRTGCRVFTYSRVGYGRSSSCLLPRTVQYMHEEAGYLSAILDHVPGESFILTGHSDGGSIATIYAGDNPDKIIDGLVLMAPHFFVESLTIQSIEKVRKIYETTDLRRRLIKCHGDQIDNTFCLQASNVNQFHVLSLLIKLEKHYKKQWLCCNHV